MARLAFIIHAAVAAAAAASPLERRQVPDGVPSFVLDFAPLVYLHSEDPYRPSCIRGQLDNSQPQVNFTVVADAPDPLTLDNLNTLNDLGGKDVYLTSKDNIEDNPAWLLGQTPDENGKTGDAVTCAIIVNDHGDGTVDAFYMYFHAYNFGGVYFGFTVGNHVGDWEHNMIRFKDSQPQALWYSQHSEGQAFKYSAVDKQGDRPLAFSANGSHAVYGTSGTHDHTVPNIDLPDGPLQDSTDEGPLWDPTLSAYYYSYDAGANTFTAYDGSSPVNWLFFNGRWGDQRYPESDPRQEFVLGIDSLAKYGNGPTGPIDKQLSREDVCPDNGNPCIVRDVLVP